MFYLNIIAFSDGESVWAYGIILVKNTTSHNLKELVNWGPCVFLYFVCMKNDLLVYTFSLKPHFNFGIAMANNKNFSQVTRVTRDNESLVKNKSILQKSVLSI